MKLVSIPVASPPIEDPVALDPEPMNNEWRQDEVARYASELAGRPPAEASGDAPQSWWSFTIPRTNGGTPGTEMPGAPEASPSPAARLSPAGGSKSPQKPRPGTGHRGDRPVGRDASRRQPGLSRVEFRAWTHPPELRTNERGLLHSGVRVPNPLQ